MKVSLQLIIYFLSLIPFINQYFLMHFSSYTTQHSYLTKRPNQLVLQSYSTSKNSKEKEKKIKEINMVSVEIVQASEAATRSINEQPTSPRISFSADFLDETDFISITPQSYHQERRDQEKEKEKGKGRIADFEFLSNNVSTQNMLTADELFFDGKLLPFWQIQHSEKLNKISLKAKDVEEEEEEAEVINKESTERKVNWFVDDDPSPRPPKCTVLWKELLRLKKQRASSLSPSSSPSSTSSSSSSLPDMVPTDERKEGSGNREKYVKRIKKGLERTRSSSIRIRPMINVPICTQVKSTALPPLFPLNPKKGRLER